MCFPIRVWRFRMADSNFGQTKELAELILFSKSSWPKKKLGMELTLQFPTDKKFFGSNIDNFIHVGKWLFRDL